MLVQLNMLSITTENNFNALLNCKFSQKDNKYYVNINPAC